MCASDEIETILKPTDKKNSINQSMNYHQSFLMRMYVPRKGARTIKHFGRKQEQEHVFVRFSRQLLVI